MSEALAAHLRIRCAGTGASPSVSFRPSSQLSVAVLVAPQLAPLASRGLLTAAPSARGEPPRGWREAAEWSRGLPGYADAAPLSLQVVDPFFSGTLS